MSELELYTCYASWGTQRQQKQQPARWSYPLNMFVLETVSLAGNFSSGLRGTLLWSPAGIGVRPVGFVPVSSAASGRGLCACPLVSPPSIASRLGSGTELVAPVGTGMSIVPMPWRAGAPRDEFPAALMSPVLLAGAGGAVNTGRSVWCQGGACRKGASPGPQVPVPHWCPRREMRREERLRLLCHAVVLSLCL